MVKLIQDMKTTYDMIQAESDNNQMIWDIYNSPSGAVKAEIDPSVLEIKKEYRYGTYGDVYVYVMKDGSIYSRYEPTNKCLRWINKQAVWGYAKAMSKRCNSMNRMLC